MRVYLITSTPYALLHHRFQKIADTLRKAGVPVTYVEHTYGWKEFLRHRRAELIGEIARSALYHTRACARLLLRTKKKSVHRRQDGEKRDFEIASLPVVIPNNRFDFRILDMINASVYRIVLEDRVLGTMHSSETSIAVVDNPLWGQILRKGDFTHIVYDCIDEVGVYAGRSSVDRALLNEKLLVNFADFIFVTAQSLEKHIRTLDTQKPVRRIPNGVDYQWFVERAEKSPVPQDLATKKRPIVGYVGTLYEWIDFDLVQRVAAKLPEVSFVFVGPVDRSDRIRVLSSLPNMTWLGKKSYTDIPAYVQAFDVCTIPFREGGIAESTNPIKLFEYFALGKPVVTTAMNEVKPFTVNKLSYMGRGVDEYVKAIREALADHSGEKSSARKEVARLHSWKEHVEQMLGVFEELSKHAS